MPEKTLLEDFIAAINANTFLREFAFSATQLRVPGLGEIELADHLVLLDDIALVFQLKEREAGAPSSGDDVQRWFASKVLKKGIQQLRETHRLLQLHKGRSLVNDRGHLISLPDPTPPLSNIVVYRAKVLPAPIAGKRSYASRTIGFVHILRDIDYFGICRILVTPAEIRDFLAFRERVMVRGSPAPAVSEAALVGQFLVDAENAAPNERFRKAFIALRDDPDDWDISFMTQRLGDQIAYQEGDPSEQSYYKLLAEIAKLSRSELREFKLRLRLALEAVREDRYEPPYRFAVPRTNCGFLLLPVIQEMRPMARNALRNFSLASKHEQKVEKQVGAAIWKSGKHIDIEWLYTEYPNEPNPELDELLRRDSPFRSTRERLLPRYYFETERLKRLLEDDLPGDGLSAE